MCFGICVCVFVYVCVFGTCVVVCEYPRAMLRVMHVHVHMYLYVHVFNLRAMLRVMHIHMHMYLCVHVFWYVDMCFWCRYMCFDVCICKGVFVCECQLCGMSSYICTLQHTATHCNTLQHTATHRTTPNNRCFCV